MLHHSGVITIIGRALLFAMTIGSPSLVPVATAEVTSPVLLINSEAESAKVEIRHLRENVSLITGSGGNIVVLNGKQGKLLGDSGLAVSKAKLQAVLATLGPTPVKYVINTHYHWDHTDGNEWMHEAGAIIVAHENTRKRLASGTRVIEWGYTFPPAVPAALPTLVFANDKIIDFEGESVLLRHYGTGHTDTDVAIHFRKADILHIGDIWGNAHYPFLDNGAGGSIDGLIGWVDECIRAATDRTIIIPGHGEPGNRAGLIDFRDMLVAVRANISRLKREGRTLAETIDARPTADYDEKYGRFLIGPAFFIQLVYMGV